MTVTTFPAHGARVAARRHSAGGRYRADAAIAAAPAVEAAQIPGAEGGGYRSRSNPLALPLVILLHVGVLAALLLARGTVFEAAPPPDPMQTFEVRTAAPPPAAPPEPVELALPDTPPPPAPVVAPPPTIRVRDVSVPIRVSPVPVPPAPPVAIKAVAAPAAAAAVPAPAAAPAPITPPDFNAAQLDNPVPVAPYLSRKAREQGTVTLRVRVSADGRAESVRIDRSSGYPRLDQAALKTVRKWEFVPARQAGEAIAAWVLVPITFAAG